MPPTSSVLITRSSSPSIAPPSFLSSSWLRRYLTLFLQDLGSFLWGIHPSNSNSFFFIKVKTQINCDIDGISVKNSVIYRSLREVVTTLPDLVVSSLPCSCSSHQYLVYILMTQPTPTRSMMRDK